MHGAGIDLGGRQPQIGIDIIESDQIERRVAPRRAGRRRQSQTITGAHDVDGQQPDQQRQKDFGPPAPPKDKKKPFKKNDEKPRGPIPTKFSGRMYDLDGTDEDDSIDITPDFMKHEEPDVDTDGNDGDDKE